MVVFPAILLKPARDAGIKTPSAEKVGEGKWDEKKFKRWTLFCNAQLGRRMPSPTSHWENAKVIAKVPEDQLETITMGGLVELGFD